MRVDGIPVVTSGSSTLRGKIQFGSAELSPLILFFLASINKTKLNDQV